MLYTAVLSGSSVYKADGLLCEIKTAKKCIWLTPCAKLIFEKFLVSHLVQEISIQLIVSNIGNLCIVMQLNYLETGASGRRRGHRKTEGFNTASFVPTAVCLLHEGRPECDSHSYSFVLL